MSLLVYDFVTCMYIHWIISILFGGQNFSINPRKLQPIFNYLFELHSAKKYLQIVSSTIKIITYAYKYYII